MLHALHMVSFIAYLSILSEIGKAPHVTISLWLY